MPRPETRSLDSSSSSQITAGIIIYLYGDHNASNSELSICITEFGLEFTAEELCLKAAKQLKFSPLTAPLLALATKKDNLFQPPNVVIHCSADSLDEFILRIRFVPPENVIGRILLSSLHSNMFNYLFLQIRHDFINDRIDYRETTVVQEHRDREETIKQEHLLGLGVIDMVRYSKEHQTELRRLEPQHFIPVSARGRFRLIWDRKRLQMNFKPHLEKEYERYKNDNEMNIKLTYVKSILGYTDHNYGAETFVLSTVDGIESNAKVAVRPYDRNFPGISVCERKSVSFHTTIADLMDISLVEKPSGVVHINRRTGMPKVLQFKCHDKALSFLSLVDGYYRLQEDYHHHLCKDIESPLLNRLRSLRCHGPVSKEWAEKRLTDRHSRDSSFNFLLRQSEKEFDVYTLVYMTPQKAMFLQIKQVENEKYQLIDKDGSEPFFASMSELIENYRKVGTSGKAVIALNKCVFPVNPLDSKVYLCRTDAKAGEEIALHRPQKTPVNLISVVPDPKLLVGGGDFTEVLLTSLEKRPDESKLQDVVVKRLKKDTNVPLEHFTHSIHQAVFWNHPTIVSVLAVCLAPVSVIMERAVYGSLKKFLMTKCDNLKVVHLILAAEQLAQALFYLHDIGEVHGNIRCRNVLVFRGELKGRFIVKLADNGLVHYYNSLPFDHPINVERWPWLSPEIFSRKLSLSAASDIYSFGVCLWEIFSGGKHPCCNLPSVEQTLHFKQNSVLPKPDKCPDDVYNIMKSCWDVTPEARFAPLVIVRNIRSLLAKESETGNVYNDPLWSDKSTTASGSDRALNSFAAVADNEANAKRMLLNETIHPKTTTACRAHNVNSSSELDASLTSSNVEPSSAGTAIDSGTPLLRPGSSGVSSDCLTRLMQSESGISAISSDATCSTDLENSTSTGLATATGSNKGGCVSSIQSRPLPQPPQNDNIGRNLQLWNIQIDQSKTLGQGHYGEVMKGTYINDSCVEKDVAIKRLKKSMTERYANEFEKEFGIMLRLQHPNIVQIIGKCHDLSECMLLVMEFVANGCLRDYLKRHENSELPARELLRFGRETAEGMVYLSSKKIIHRDLATRNVLVTADIHMKISDFGLSRALDNDRDYYKCTDDRTDLPAPWCAPEALLYRRFSERSDVWSYGVTLWEIFSFGMNPRLGEIADLPALIHQGRRLQIPKGCPKPVYELMLFKCWQFYPEERWTFKQILDELLRQESTLFA